MKKSIFWVPCTKYGDKEWHPVVGEMIVVSGWKDYPMILSKGGVGGLSRWEISHLETGARIVVGATQNEAILNLIEKLESSKHEKFNEAIKKMKKKLPKSVRPISRVVESWKETP